MKFRLLKPLTILSTLLIILLCFTASASAFFVSSEKIHVGKIFFSDAFFTRNFSPLTAENTPVKNYDDKNFASVSLLVPKSGLNKIDDVIQVTPNGISLPSGIKIPKNLIENPYRPGSYGKINPTTGKFTETLRIDPPTEFQKTSHFHIDGGKEHLTDMNLWPKE